MGESWVLLPDSEIERLRNVAAVENACGEDPEMSLGDRILTDVAHELVRLNPDGIEPEYEWDVEHQHPYQPDKWTRHAVNGGRDVAEELAAASDSFRLVRRAVGPWVPVESETP